MMNEKSPRRLIIILRPIISTVVLAPEIYFRKSDPFSQVFPLVIIILLSYFASIAFYLVLKTRNRGRVYDFAQTVTDTIIVTGLVGFTGSVNSAFSLLFFLNILEGSFFLRPSGAFTVTTIAAASFVATGILWMNQHLPKEIEIAVFNIESMHYFLKIFIFVLFFYLSTALIIYFKERFSADSQILEDILMTTDDILENIHSGIITIDKNGRIKHCNPAAISILSLDNRKKLITPYEKVFPARLKELAELISSFSGDERINRRLLVLNTFGRKIPLMVTISPMKRENIDYGGILVSIIDLTEEEEVQKRLRTSDRMKTALELSAGIAHEIRNPLASIQGALEVITEQIRTRDKKVKKLVHLVLKEAGRLNNIIERFLQFVRIPKGEKKNINLSHILRDVVELVKNHPSYNKGIEISVKFPLGENPIVFADPEQIKQVFINILLNAFSAVGKTGKIDIYFSLQDNASGITFEDNGKGMSKQELEKIFQPFYSKTQGGSGLGLSVAHRIIEQHGGEILTESEEGEGSNFTVWLPSDRKSKS